MAITTILDDISPTEIGMPDKFDAFRQAQREMVDYGVHGPQGYPHKSKQYVGWGAPPGAGKTLAIEAAGAMLMGRRVTLTATKSLQDQRAYDFQEKGMIDIRGRVNYDCPEVSVRKHGYTQSNCQVGAEHGCRFSNTTACPHKAIVDQASSADSISSNYQYWMHARGNNELALEGAGTIDTLFMDEAHLAVDELCMFLSTWISVDDMAEYGLHFSGGKKQSEMPWLTGASQGLEHGYVDGTWLEFLKAMSIKLMLMGGEIAGKYNNSPTIARQQSEEYRKIDNLVRELNKVTRHGNDGNWIWQFHRKGIKFDIVWPWRYAHKYLFSGVQKVILASATLRPKLFPLLGLKREDVDFKEWPRQFPANLSPVYRWPIVKMTWANGDDAIKKMAEAVDMIQIARPGRKILVQTHSYERARKMRAYSRFNRFMFVPSPGSKEQMMKGELTYQEAIDKYRREPCSPGHPVILMGPSFSTGLDLPDADCEVNIIIKLPYPDIKDPIMNARKEDDPSYADYVTMQTVVQGCGRATRHDKDRSETFILDESFVKFGSYAREHAPRWFSTIPISSMPKCPPKL